MGTNSPEAQPQGVERPLLASIFPGSGQTVPAVGDAYVVTNVSNDVLDLHFGNHIGVELRRADLPRAAADTQTIIEAIQGVRNANDLDDGGFFEAGFIAARTAIIDALLELFAAPRASGETTVESARIWRKVKMAIQTYDGSGTLFGVRLGSARSEGDDSEGNSQ